jgi:cytochrome c biogenesis protein CcdA
VPSETPAPSVEPPKGDAPPPPSATSDPPPPPPLTEPGDADESTSSAWPSSSSPSAARLAPRAWRDRFADEFALVLIAIQAQTPPPAAAGDDLGLPPEADLPPEAPIGASPATAPTGPVRAITADEAREPSRSTVKVPVLGTLDVRKLGMPAFTFLIGLIDGFNPCAMWVLVFLLSVLAGLNDRRKLIIVAGTFVLISGLAYFIFMAAWLNVFRLIGLVRWAQIALGVLAVGMGAIHIKDFFAFKKGLSLSIPESAKPGIYAKVRKIAAAESLWVALGTAIVMAVLVNMVELLCTAGLPALYTSILSYQGYPRLVEYLYLGLYILAYMFDDTILLLVVAVTLSRRRLQEREGRWLKLVSGVVILALGIVMLFAPTWLV